MKAAVMRAFKAPLELEALDLAWRGGRGGILARSGGVCAAARAERAAAVMREAGLQSLEVVEDDAELWARQRAGQRSAGGVLVRVAVPPTALPDVLGAAEACAATVVGRAALGHCFIELDPDALARLVERLPASAHRVVLDAPPAARDRAAPWGKPPAPELLDLMRRVKRRFDPAQICSPGVFVGGI